MCEIEVAAYDTSEFWYQSSSTSYQQQKEQPIFSDMDILQGSVVTCLVWRNRGVV